MTNRFLKLSGNILLSLLLTGCLNSSQDNDLVRPDGHGDSYLTPLGCLLNGPWNIDNMNDCYNEKLFFNNKELSSRPVPFNEIQRDLVFELHKDGELTFWLKSENDFMNDTSNIRVKIIQSPENDNLKKIYSSGSWKASIQDSCLLIVFKNKKLPKLNFKWIALGNGFADFQQSYFFESVYNGKKVVMKRVNTIHYETLYPRF